MERKVYKVACQFCGTKNKILTYSPTCIVRDTLCMKCGNDLSVKLAGKYNEQKH